MPIYEYECSACGERSEFIQKFSDDPKTDCKLCGEKGSLSKLISSPAIQFKGEGWYLTDYSDKGKRMKNAAEKESPATASETKSTETKKESKSGGESTAAA